MILSFAFRLRTAKDIEIWVSQDIIAGRFSESKPAVLEVNKASMIAFIDYHTTFLKQRAREVSDDLVLLQTKKTKKE